MLRRLRPKYASNVPLSSSSLSLRPPPVGLRLLRHRELACDYHPGGGTQVRFYAQQPPNGGGFPGFSFQPQRNKGDALKEFVSLPSIHRMTADDAKQR